MDSEGSKGYVNYVSRERAHELNIANVTYETIDSSIFGDEISKHTEDYTADDHGSSPTDYTTEKEPFVYMSTSPSEEGPRYSVRLEGLRRFNRGLFILDLRHMPVGCATWPAFWLTVSRLIDAVTAIFLRCK